MIWTRDTTNKNVIQISAHNYKQIICLNNICKCKSFHDKTAYAEYWRLFRRYKNITKKSTYRLLRGTIWASQHSGEVSVPLDRTAVRSLQFLFEILRLGSGWGRESHRSQGGNPLWAEELRRDGEGRRGKDKGGGGVEGRRGEGERGGEVSSGGI